MAEIVLTPEELFFLASKMEAKYLDYEYLSMMGDIQTDYEVKETKAMESLSSKGYIEEDFEGNIEVGEDVSKIVSPLFFGKIECLIKKEADIKLHITDEMITECLKTDDGLVLRNIDTKGIEDILTGDLELQCANTEKGTYIQQYTASQLEDSNFKAVVVKIAKGEW